MFPRLPSSGIHTLYNLWDCELDRFYPHGQVIWHSCPEDKKVIWVGLTLSHDRWTTKEISLAGWRKGNQRFKAQGFHMPC